MHVILVIVVAFSAGFLIACRLKPDKPAKPKAPDIEACLEIIDTCTAALKKVESDSFISDEPTPEVKNLRLAIASAAQRLAVATTTSVLALGESFDELAPPDPPPDGTRVTGSPATPLEGWTRTDKFEPQ